MSVIIIIASRLLVVLSSHCLMLACATQSVLILCKSLKAQNLECCRSHGEQNPIFNSFMSIKSNGNIIPNWNCLPCSHNFRVKAVHSAGTILMLLKCQCRYVCVFMQDELYVLLYANSSWFLFIRLYHMFCQRLRDIRRIAVVRQRESTGILESSCEQFVYYTAGFPLIWNVREWLGILLMVRNKQLCCRKEAARCFVSISSQLRCVNSTIPGAQFFYCQLLQLRIYQCIQFGSVVFGVTSSLAVIHMINRDCVQCESALGRTRAEEPRRR